MMSEDFHWFVENYDALNHQYGDGFLVIKNKHVLRVCDSYAEGVRSLSKNVAKG